jgi:hypothetical protein
MPEQYTFPVACLGFGIFAIAVFGRLHMMRTVGANLAFNNKKLVDCYKGLVRDGLAPRWPLIAPWVCVPLSFAIAFGSILFSR